MLKQRVMTALVLLLVLLPAVFYSDIRFFAGVALLLIGAAAWEWSRLNGANAVGAWIGGLTCAGLCLASWYAGVIMAPLKLLWLISGATWVILGAWLLRSGVSAWATVPRWLRQTGGILGLWVAWIAVIQARAIGINFIFSVLALVWVADIGAYFAGRALGGRWVQRKLAPSVSPGKTWEGALGGMLGVLVCALTWSGVDGYLALPASLYTHLAQNGIFFMVLAVLFLATMSVVGDLVESLFKRSAGVKDSSGLLPGHGGVLDRIDALLPTLPLAMMLVSL
jgi:phosphatidate cytidylyltransferase